LDEEPHEMQALPRWSTPVFGNGAVPYVTDRFQLFPGYVPSADECRKVELESVVFFWRVVFPNVSE
jgi:hypothetical protein